MNFWKPSDVTFKALEPGEILLFKLRAPDNCIAGGGFFTRYLRLPLNTVWDTLGEANGVRSLMEMRDVIGGLRHEAISSHYNQRSGASALPNRFLGRSQWIPAPDDFKWSTVSGKRYESETGYGRQLWEAVSERLRHSSATRLEQDTATAAAIESNGFGQTQLVNPRPGQGIFRALLTDFYSRKCAITGERTLPVLEAAHIKPYALVQRHELANGLLLRSDLHKLFDEGYLSIDPKERRLLVSKRIREEFENGKDYYRLEGQTLREPTDLAARPLTENLEYHAAVRFRGLMRRATAKGIRSRTAAQPDPRARSRSYRVNFASIPAL